VLLVEDNEINQIVACNLLKNAGIQVSTAENGSAALETLAKESFDLVLMDIQMPVMDGYDATIALRAQAQFADLPIIAMTAHAYPEEKAKCLSVGMNDLITKPVRPEVLFGLLGQYFPGQTRCEQLEPPAVTGGFEKGEVSSSNCSLDVQSGLRYAHGNARLYRQVLEGFCTRYSESPQQLVHIITDDTHENARFFTHSLRGVAGTIGATRLLMYTSEIELLIGNDDVPLPVDLLQRLVEEMQCVLSEINDFLH
jgi:CheY-like chemotaxis protein